MSTSAISHPPIYSHTIDIPQNYFPSIPGAYRHPALTREEKKQLDLEKKEKIELALSFLANLDLSTRKIEKKTTYITKNSCLNLFSYLCCNKIEIIKRAFFCFCSKDQALNKPIPRDAFETLALTREQFDRNTLGVCCIAPAVIIGTPFIPVGPTIETLLNIFSGLVITTTAGTNTYVFSGDIGVVPNGRKDLCVQGGIRVDAITQIENAYKQMAIYLKEKWAAATPEEKRGLEEQCKKIIKNWDFIFEEIANCGLKNLAVENILASFATTLGNISDEFENPNENAVHWHTQ